MHPMPLVKGVICNKFMAKHATAIFVMSRSTFARDNSDCKRLISIYSLLTIGAASPFRDPFSEALIQLCCVYSDRPRFLAAVA